MERLAGGREWERRSVVGRTMVGRRGWVGMLYRLLGWSLLGGHSFLRRSCPEGPTLGLDRM